MPTGDSSHAQCTVRAGGTEEEGICREGKQSVMELRLCEEPADDAETLKRYGTVPIAFRVTSRLAVRPVESGLGGLLLAEEPVAAPYVKDYDALDGEGPTRWRDHFDLSRWGVIAAFDGAAARVGGAVLAWDTPGGDMLEGRRDLAVLWDLRVRPEYRGQGVGAALFAAAAAWARARGCRELKIETQNVNVPACRFYARQGSVLRTIRQGAYPDLPDEVQLLWY